MLPDTLEEAVECFAKRAADLSMRPRSFQEKQAAGVSDILTSVGDQVRSNPALGHALLGGGVGAGLGGLSSLIGNQDKEDKDKRSIGHSMLLGGLGGAALGGGASLAHSSLMGSKGGLGGGEGGGEGTGPGTFDDPTTGKKFQISPDVLKENPELAAKVRGLSHAGDPISSGIQHGMGNVWNYARRAATIPSLGLSRLLPGYNEGENTLDKYAPTSGQVVPMLGGLDVALNAPLLRAGERTGLGYARPEMSRNPLDIMEGLSAKAEVKPGSGGARNLVARDVEDAATKAQTALNTPLGDTWYKRLGNRLLGRYGGGGDPVYTEPMPANPTTAAFHASLPHDPTELPGSLLRSEAMKANLAGHKVHTGFKADGKASPRGIFRAGPWDFKPGRLAHIGGRIAGYGMIPVAEIALRSMMQQKGRDQELRDMLSKYTKEVK